MTSLSRVYVACTRGALLLATFLVPITMLPWASEPLEIHKQTLTIVLVIVATLSWLGHVVMSRRLSIQKRVLFLLPVLVVVGGFLSPGLSNSAYLSIVGQVGQEYTSLLSLTIFAVMMVLVAHQSDDRQLHRQWSAAILLSSGVVALYTSFTLLGSFGRDTLFTLIGTPNACAIFFIATTTFGSALWLTSRNEADADVMPTGLLGVMTRVAVVVSGALLVFMLITLDYGVLWALTLIATGSMMAFALVRAHDFPHIGRFFVPIGLFVTALVFLFLPSPITSPFPAEVGMSTKGSWHVAQSVLSSGEIFFGNGPGTFGFAYNQYHDPAIAESNFWDVTFDRGSSHIITMVTTFGLVGTLLHVLFILGTGGVIFAKLAREKMHAEWKYTFAPTMAWITLAAAQFLYPANFTLSFLFWLLSGILLSQVAVTSWDWNFVRSPRVAIVSAFMFVCVLVGLVVTVFVAGSRYAADIAFAKAQATDRAGGSIDDVITALDRAALTNRWSDTYYRNLGHVLLLKTADVLSDTDADPAYVQELIAASINASLRATSLGRADVMNWDMQGDAYREIGPLVEGADDYAIAAYQEAITRSPSNPKYYVDLARAYFVKADKALIAAGGDDAALAATAQADRNQALATAYVQLEKAIALREQYAPAHFYMAYVLERQGKISDAIVSMERLKVSDPYDVGVALQLGLLYLKQGKSIQAKAEFERALELVPDYANAHWYLASIYEEDGDFVAAIAEIEAILLTDPDNATVKQRLQNLQNGLTASQIPDPIETSLPVSGTEITE